MKKLLIVGDVMLDRYVMGAVERISPEAPVPVVRVTHEELKPGGAANVASNTAGLKIHTLLFGVVGNDQNGEALSALATSLNIDQRFVKESIPTICKIRVIGNHQQIVRFDYEEVRNTPERISALQNLTDEILIFFGNLQFNKPFLPLLCPSIFVFSSSLYNLNI